MCGGDNTPRGGTPGGLSLQGSSKTSPLNFGSLRRALHFHTPVTDLISLLRRGAIKKKNLQPALPWGFPFQPGIRPHPVDAVTLRTLLGKCSVLWAAPKGHGSQPLPSCWHPVRQGETPRARHCPSKTRARVLGSGVGWAQGFATHPPHPPACSQIWPLSQEHRVHPTRDGAPHAPPKSFLNSSSASLKQGRAAPHIFLGSFRAAELPQAPLQPHGHASRP